MEQYNEPREFPSKSGTKKEWKRIVLKHRCEASTLAVPEPQLRLDIYKDGNITTPIRTLYVTLKPRMTETIRTQEIQLKNIFCDKIKVKRSATIDYRLYEFGIIYEDGRRVEGE